ncbi:MAG: hypothetical protein QXS32_08260 [Candidatus Nezhaarchaeales archaeon]
MLKRKIDYEKMRKNLKITAILAVIALTMNLLLKGDIVALVTFLVITVPILYIMYIKIEEKAKQQKQAETQQTNKTK